MSGDAGDPSAWTAGDTAESGRRRDGWLVTYKVQVYFDADVQRRRYDYVGTVACCTCCGARLPIQSMPANFVLHAQEHEALLSVERAVEELAVEPPLPHRRAVPHPPGLLP